MFGWRTMIAFPFVTVCSGDYLMVAFIGIISAGAFMSYITASRHFSFSLFGLMGFVEPVLLVIVSLLLGKIKRQKSGLRMCLSGPQLDY